MKKEILVTYEEILSKTVTISINDEEDIVTQVRRAYQDEQVVLSAPDLQNSQFLIDTPTVYDDWVEI
ncbi:hypothetical protein [Weissella paramesenteroides]|uniref:hypothetical protein n=1 Tax=Weissella paramesenteroides TaxID=1249 RepID=UPI00388CFDCA